MYALLAGATGGMLFALVSRLYCRYRQMPLPDWVEPISWTIVAAGAGVRWFQII